MMCTTTAMQLMYVKYLLNITLQNLLKYVDRSVHKPEIIL